MSPGTQSSRAAPGRQRLAAQTAFEVRSLLSNGEQLLVSIILPLLELQRMGR